MSQQNKQKPRIFFGWWSVTFIGIVSGIGHGFNTYGISLFFKHIADDLKIGRAATSWAPGIGRLEGGLSSPLVGWLSDKFGPRWMVIIGLAIAGTGMVLMNYITEVWQYIVVWGGLIGLGLNIGLTVAADKNINDWFIRRRGLAQGIKFGLVSLMGIAVVQVIGLILDNQDWRYACMVWGIVMFACIPLAYYFIKPKRPEYYGLLPDGADIGPGGSSPEELIRQGIGYASSLNETEYSYKQATRSLTFWLLVVGFSAHNVITSGFNLHVYPFLTDLGIGESAASGMLGLMIFFTVPVRFFGGLFADKIRKDRMQLLLAGAFLFQVIGISLYLTSGETWSVYVLLACHGMSSGAITPLVILMLGRYFGRKAFGSLLGTMSAFLAPMGLLAPVFYGWIHDITLSYHNAFVTSLILASVAAITTFFIRPPRELAETAGEPITS